MASQSFILYINLLLSSTINDPILKIVFDKCWLKTYNNIIKKIFILLSSNFLAIIGSDYKKK